MPIPNYTTKESSSKTIGEIQEILKDYGARKITLDYDEAGRPINITFNITLDTGIPIYFSLTANISGMLVALKEDAKVPTGFCTEKQAEKVAWRVIKDWIRMQCAMVDAKQATMEKIFIGKAITAQSSIIEDQVFNSENQLLLPQ